MTRGIFVTGTDTGVGKTAVAVALLRLLSGRGRRTAAFKPVASGAVRGPDGRLRNDDALDLQAAASVPLEYDRVNPWCFEPAIAPHLAARDAGTELTVAALVEAYRRIAEGTEIVVVEGAGGWRVPLHPRGFLSDLPEALGLDVILVVGLRLGCLNHARLTAEAIRATGRSRWLGWIGNAIDPVFERAPENLASLAELLDAPPLALVPWSAAAPRTAHGHAIVDFTDAARLAAALDPARSD